MSKSRHTRSSAARRCAAVANRPSFARVCLLFLALLALTIQAFIVQPHIHVASADGGAKVFTLMGLDNIALAQNSGATAAKSNSVPRDKYPASEDPSNCPLCQELAYSGQYVTSAAVLASLPVSVTVNFIEFNEVLPSLVAVSHIWQGRAPPQN